MAQLPPKAPAMVQKWSSFGYQTMPISVSQAPNWLDDFIDFASTRRNSHRRTSSDPITFVEMNECDNSNRSDPMIPCSNSNNGFECLDDEQISSMFTDDNVSTDFQPISSIIPCDQYSDNDETKTTSLQEQQMKNEPGEVEDAGCDYELERESESAKQHPLSFSSDGGTIVDPKRVKRILANRQSAQRSRVRKLHYISELERSVTNLQTEVSTLSPRVAYLDHQRLILNVDNSSLKQRIAALAQDKIFKDAHQEALRKEIERLRRVYNDQQNMNKHADNTTTGPMTSPSRPPQPPPTSMDEARASDHHGSDN